MRRRELLSRLPCVLLAVPVVGCLSNEEDDYPVRPGGTPSGGSAPPGGAAAFTAINADDSGHSHSFEIRCSQRDQGAQVFVADGPHKHDVTLTDAQLDAIFRGDTVRIDTNDIHPHTWVIRKPAEACD